MSEADADRVLVGHISGVFGVRGWVRVYSDTDPRDNILRYSPWQLGQEGATEVRRVLGGRLHGEGVVAQVEGITDRDAAAALVGSAIRVNRSQLGTAGEGRYFWTDLQGLEVRTEDGLSLGVVEQLLETGANDVLVVTGERRRLIPFLYGPVVRSVDLAGRLITVDWDADF